MTKRMLIDATHEEETRVAITDGNKLIEYDYESSSRKPIKGNIYLAKVTRVEPSLQAAFVNFGGNRHGFLPFSEIHPDYFRIPISDREALMAEQDEYLRRQEEKEALLEQEEEQDAAEDNDSAQADDDQDGDEEAAVEIVEIGGSVPSLDDDEDGQVPPQSAVADADEDTSEGDGDVFEDDGADAEAQDDADSHSGDDSKSEDEQGGGDDNDKRGRRNNGRGRRNNNGRGRGRRSQFRNKGAEVVGEDDVDEEQRFRFNLRRKYKIQEVIKRGQIMLVQANKEERGNKGAALSSYLSLPGRYCVLMPNSPRAGGVSRKIANYKDRARMREMMRDLEVPKGMSVIVRTAGVTRTKTEIKRDLDYLLRLWGNIRDLTLQSTAPAVVYEEADLIKRSVRDLYTREVEEILVSGEDGYNVAKSFMKMLIPSHVKKVNLYEETQIPLFNRYQIESQIEEIGLPEVRLRSGGYLVINPTEALVSIDVNSGKSTKGRHIEETALKTNLEAADEVARQLRLRDLGGLVVVDFIDMEDRRSNGKVERRMREALSTDRARVQVGRISSFGLMELSRQRLSPSLTEAQFEKCTHCAGTGLVRTADAMSITVLRAIEEEGLRARAAQVVVHVGSDVALYILNYKRKNLAEIEERYSFQILLRVDNDIAQSDFRIEVSRPIDEGEEATEEGESESGNAASQSQNQSHGQSSSNDGEDDGEGNRNRRRRGRRGGRGRNRRDSNADQNGDNRQDEAASSSEAEASSEHRADDAQPDSGDKEGKTKSRGGRGRSQKSAAPAEHSGDQDAGEHGDGQSLATEDAPKPKRGRKRKVEIAEVPEASADAVVDTAGDSKSADDAGQEKPKKKPAVRRKKDDAPAVNKKAANEAGSEPVAKEYEVVNEAPVQKKRGWWNKLVE